MKFRSFLLAAAAMLFAVACNETPDEPLNPEAQVAVMPLEVSYVANGGENAVSVVAKGAWTATPSAEWITVSPASGEAGTVSVKVTAAKNEVTEAREGVVTFAVGAEKAELKVKQAAGVAAGGDLWTLTGNDAFAGAAGVPAWAPADGVVVAWDGAYYAAKGLTLPAKAEFKFTNGSWDVNRGYNGGKAIVANYFYAAEANGANITIAADGTYDIYLNADADTFYVMEAGKAPAEAQDSETMEDAEVDPADAGWRVVGAHTGWNEKEGDDMTLANGYWGITNVELTAEANEFKFVQNRKWAGAVGYTGELLNAGYYYTANTDGGAGNIKLAAGTYDLYLNEDATKFYILNPGQTPDEAQDGEAASAVTTWDLAALGLTSFKGANSSGEYQLDSYNEDESWHFWLKLVPADGVLATEEGVWYDGYQDSEERSVFGYIDENVTWEFASIVAGSMCLSTTDVEGVYEMLIPEGDPLIFEGSNGNYSVSGVYTVNMTVETKVEFWINPDAGLGGQMLMCESTMSMGLPGHYFAMQTDGGDFAMITLLDMENMENYVYPTSGFYGLMGEPMPGQKGVLVGYEQFGYFTIGGVKYFPYMPESTTDEMGRSYGVEVWNGAEMGMDVLMLDFYLPVFTLEGDKTVISGCYQGPAGFGGAVAKPEVELNLELFGFTHFTAVVEGNMAVLTSRSMNGSLMLNISNWGDPFAMEEGVVYIAGDNLLDGELIIDDGFDYFECPLKKDGGRMMLYSTETPNTYEVVFSSRAPLTFEGASVNYVLPKEIDTYEITIDGLMSAPAGEGDESDDMFNVMVMPFGGPNYALYFYYGGNLVQLDVFNASTSDGGLVAGTYNVGEYADYTGTGYIAAGSEVLEGMGYGSYFYTADMELVDIITGGTMNVVTYADGTYTISVNLTGENGTTYEGEYTGEVQVLE